MAQSGLVWTQTVEVPDHAAARSAVETALGGAVYAEVVYKVLRQSKHSSYIALKAPQDSGLYNNVVELLKKDGGKVVELTDLEFRARVSGDADLKRRRIDQQEQLSKSSLGLLEAAVRLRGSHGTDRQNLLASERILRIADRVTAAQADGLRHKAQQVQAEQESSAGP